MPGTWSFTADMSQYGPFSAPAVGFSTGRSDAVSSLGSTRWSSRISGMTGLWSLAGLNNTKPLVLSCYAFSLTAAGGGGILGVPGVAVAGPLGAAHPSDSCGIGFIETAADLESQVDIISEVPKGSIRFSPDGRPPHILSLIRAAAWEERCSGVDGGCVLSPPTLRGRRARSSPPSEIAGPSSEASVPSRIPGTCARSNRRFRWPARRPRSQGSYAHSYSLQFWLAVTFHVSYFSKVERPSVSRGSHSARNRCTEPSHPSSWQANAHTPTIKRRSRPPSFRPCRSARRAGLIFLTGSAAHVLKRKKFGRGAHRRRSRVGRTSSAGRPCRRAPHSAHPSRMPWNYHCGAREESAGEPEESSQGALKSVAASDPDASQPADRHEARAGIVARKSCCLVPLLWALLM